MEEGEEMFYLNLLRFRNYPDITSEKELLREWVPDEPVAAAIFSCFFETICAHPRITRVVSKICLQQ
jgi:hypothetical protein